VHKIQDYYASLIKAYVASHFGRFAFEVRPRRQKRLLNFSWPRCGDRAGPAYHRTDVFSIALRRPYSRRGGHRCPAGMQIHARYSTRFFCAYIYTGIGSCKVYVYRKRNRVSCAVNSWEVSNPRRVSTENIIITSWSANYLRY